MDEKMINDLIKTLVLCRQAIQVLHPVLNSDEPCIAWEAYKAADYQIAQLKDFKTKQ